MRRSVPASLLAGTLLIAAGCDYVDLPKGEQAAPTPPPSEGVTRRVLLEDFTGHTCNNCPDAARIAQQLKALYGDDLVVVGVHMTETFAAPVLPLGDGYYDTDFRTPAGNAYEQTFQVAALPTGTVSRKPYNNNIRVGRTNWASAVSQLIGTAADMDVWFDSFTYNEATHHVDATVKVACLNAITGDHSLTVYLTEDHVIDWQTDNTANPPEVPNYDHRDVLRDNLNGTWGEAVITGSAAAGDTLTRTFSYTLPGNVVTPANCALVAYVYSTGGADQYEVKQVAERKFTE